MLAHLSSKLNFTQSIVQPRDCEWGIFDGKRWSGLVGALKRGKVDLSTAGLEQTSARDAAVDFSVPVTRHVTTLIARVGGDSAAVDTWLFVELMPAAVWAAGIGIAAAFGITFLLIVVSKSAPKWPTLNRLKRATSARILLFCGSLSCLMVFDMATSDLTSRLTTATPPSPAKSFQDVLENGYNVVVIRGTSDDENLSTARPGSAMHAVYHGRMADDPAAFVTGTREAFGRLEMNKRTLYFGSIFDVVSTTQFVPLDISDSVHSQLGWAFGKNSEFTDFFSHHLLQMQETGLFRKIFRVRRIIDRVVLYGFVSLILNCPILGYKSH